MDFAERYGPWAIVAGASDGTGRAFAREIAAQGVACILVARDAKVDAVADELKAEFGVACVTAHIDLSQADAADRIIAAAEGREIGLFVANAGADNHGEEFLDQPIENALGLIGINVITTTRCCHHFGGLMRARGRGGLLLANSGACYGGSGFLAIYTASKAFVLNLAESLWTELSPHGIDVLTIAIGATDTPGYRRRREVKGRPIPSGLASPEDVARQGMERLPFGPVTNFGLADDETGHLSQSASDRREAVRRHDAAVRRQYGMAPG